MLDVGAMDANTLHADCEHCAALCCVAFPFEASPEFAVEKPAGAPCPNLEGCGRCAIHAEREEQGFGGCIPYDCLGAGQRVVQQTFAGRTWMEDPTLLEPMLRAFEVMCPVHELIALLATAGRADLSPGDRQTLQRLVAELDAVADAPLRPDALFRLHEIDGQARTFLAGLRRYFAEARRRAAGGPPEDPKST